MTHEGARATMRSRSAQRSRRAGSLLGRRAQAALAAVVLGVTSVAPGVAIADDQDGITEDSAPPDSPAIDFDPGETPSGVEQDVAESPPDIDAPVESVPTSAKSAVGVGAAQAGVAPVSAAPQQSQESSDPTELPSAEQRAAMTPDVPAADASAPQAPTEVVAQPKAPQDATGIVEGHQRPAKP